MLPARARHFRDLRKTEKGGSAVVDILSLNTSLPANIEVEKLVLGAITLNDTLLEQAISVLVTSDFYLHSHQRIAER